MGTLLKITMLYPAREDAWAQKIFRAAASLCGQAKARRALRQRHPVALGAAALPSKPRSPSVLSLSSAAVNCHRPFPDAAPAALAPLPVPRACPGLLTRLGASIVPSTGSSSIFVLQPRTRWGLGSGPLITLELC